MNRLASIGEAAQALGVDITTLRRWERLGKIYAEHTAGGHRRYDLTKLRPSLVGAKPDRNRKTVAYARVSSHDQKDDLERQKEVLELYCASQGWTFEVVSDLGSGMNYHKKGLKRLLGALLMEASADWSSRIRTDCCVLARNWYLPFVRPDR